MLEALTRTYGYSVFPASQNPNEKSKGEVRVDIEWVSDKEAKYLVSKSYFFRSGIVTSTVSVLLFSSEQVRSAGKKLLNNRTDTMLGNWRGKCLWSTVWVGM